MIATIYRSSLIFLLIFILTGCSFNNAKNTVNNNNMIKDQKVKEVVGTVRQAAVAGSFYVASEQQLKKQLNQYLSVVTAQRLSAPVAILAPHAGLDYSGATAANSFKQIAGYNFKKVLILAPSHYQLFKGAVVPSFDYYQTPLGKIKIADETRALLNNKLFQQNLAAEEPEHAIEVELPFLQMTLNDFTILPILIGSDNSYEELLQISTELKKIVDEQTLIVISTDFTHYGPNYGYTPFKNGEQKEKIAEIDNQAFTLIKKLDAQGFYNYVHDSSVTIDGGTVIPVGLQLLKNIEVAQLAYQTSGDLLKDFTNSVSYGAFAFYPVVKIEVSKDQQKELLQLARTQIDSALRNQNNDFQLKFNDEAALAGKQGVFVTLIINDQLRGCIGHIIPQEPMVKAIRDNAVSAALRDSRFSPLTLAELDKVKIEISLLTVPQLLTGKDYQDKMNKLRPNIDGIVLINGDKDATFLPQVWEQISDKQDFLKQLSLKAGMSENAWQDLSTLWYVYQVKGFEE